LVHTKPGKATYKNNFVYTAFVGIVDSSGLRITYTPNLRQHDTGVIIAGHTVSGLQQIIPSKIESFFSSSECTDQCLSSV